MTRPTRIAILFAGGLLGAFVAAAAEHVIEEFRRIEFDQQMFEHSILPGGHSPPDFEPLATAYLLCLYSLGCLIGAWFARVWIKPLPHPSRTRLHYPGAIGLAALVCGFIGVGVLIGLNLLLLARYRHAVLAVVAGLWIEVVLAVGLPDPITQETVIAFRVVAVACGVIVTRIWLADALRLHRPFSAVHTLQIGWLLAFLSTATFVHLGGFHLPR